MATFLRIFDDFSKSGVRYLGGMPGPISFLDELDHILISIAFSLESIISSRIFASCTVDISVSSPASTDMDKSTS